MIQIADTMNMRIGACQKANNTIGSKERNIETIARKKIFCNVEREIYVKFA
jgi:hypothetical protein